MINKLIRVLITILGMALGFGIVATANSFGILDMIPLSRKYIYIYIGLSLIFGIISFILSNKIIKLVKKAIDEAEKRLQNVPALDIMLGVIGLVVGFLIAYLLSGPLVRIPYGIGVVISALLYLVLGYLGIKVTTRKTDDFNNVVNVFKKTNTKEKATKGSVVKPKILDTSVIIDGRISDICKTGFVEGPLIIPEFVLKELQQIADSADGLKRNRGRRGLDIIKKMQQELDIEIIIEDKDFDEVPEVDTKLLKLTQFMSGKVVTNDYNLNKVAEVHGVEVLNINELANAVKPVVLPGEEMVVIVMKSGKEPTQGIAYLDDGTMIVVEGGREYMGKTISVLVTSVLQTAAGKMIFAKPKLPKLTENKAAQ